MPTFFNLRIPPPTNWQELEALCCDLWRAIWKDPNTQRNGRQGQPQHGVDIFGRPKPGNHWAGIQCKGKDNYTGQLLTEKEVEDEVDKAKFFQPELSQFIIATTGPKDTKIEKLARKITEKHTKNGLFSVHIWGWDDILLCLADFPEVIEKHYPEFSVDTKASKRGIDEIGETTQVILERSADIKSELSSIRERIDTSPKVNYAEMSMSILTQEYQRELDHSRDLLNEYKPGEALGFLEKLKSRIWSDASPIVKFRLLTNIGAAKLSLNQEPEAAKLFLEALQYNPEDEKALCNAALGHMLLGETEKAEALANKVVAKNPANGPAYSIIIQSSSNNEKLERVIEKVPKPHRTTPEVAYAIGYLCRKRNNFTEARKWLEIAVENDRENSPDLKGTLGEVLIQSIIKDPSSINGLQLNDLQKEQIQESISLLTSAWNHIADTDLRRMRLTWIVNRGYAKSLLGGSINIEEAIKDVEIALQMEPSHPTFMRNRALLACKIGDNKKAIKLLREIKSAKDFPEALLLLVEVLRIENRFPEAMRTIKGFLESKPPKSVKEEANRLLIDLYLDTKDFPNARKISDSMRVSNPTNILNLVDAARISKLSGKSADAISLLNEAKDYIADSSLPRELLELADEFYFFEQFEDAASIYGKVIDQNLNTPLNRKLLNFYYRAGEIDEALNICKNLRQRYGPLKHVSEMESAIYEEIGDLPEAKRVCKEYLSSSPNDFGMKLRFAVINFRTGEFEELDKFLNSSIDTSILSAEYGIQLAYLCAARNLIQKSFEIMYEIRRSFFNNGDVHLKYVGFFFQHERDADKWLKISKVSLNTAVCVKDSSGKREWYIIEDRKDAEIYRREFVLSHPLTQKLLEKSVGDEIMLQESRLSKEIGKIIEVKSKYVYAFQESLNSFEKLFPDMQGIRKIRVEPPKEEGEPPKGFQAFLDETSRQHSQDLQAEQFHKEGKLTIGAFANLIGRDVLGVWSGIISKPEVGIRCCLGNVEERNQVISLLNNKSKLIVDIISLMTLHGINAENIIIKNFGKLGIAQSTIDLLQCAVDEGKGIKSRGFITIGKEDNEFTKQGISAENVKSGTEYLENILRWVKNNCEIIPCKAALNMKRDRKRQLDEIMGTSSIDTILVASEPGNLLYSDDERLRSFARKNFNVDGVWTQIVLMNCLDANILKKAKYNEMTIKLVCSYYYYTSIDPDVLIEAARQSKWVPSEPYRTVIQLLGGEYSDEPSALIVAANFLYELWKQSVVLAQRRDYLILSLLDAITAKRNRGVILNRLISYVRRRFLLLPLAERQIIALIGAWKKMHII